MLKDSKWRKKHYKDVCAKDWKENRNYEKTSFRLRIEENVHKGSDE